jgi:hypothetical protein
VPRNVWDDGAAAANAWIEKHLPKRRAVSGPPELPEPLPDLDSPFSYAWNAALRIGVVAGAQSLPFYPFFTSEEDHRHVLEACRIDAERLLKALQERRYDNVRSEYREALEYYLDDLPKAAGVGNILLANNQARILQAMFVVDAEMLPEGFASRLGGVIANQFALNGYYDLVQRHNEAVNSANWTQPFPFEAAQRFFGAVEEKTPRLFEREVGEGLRQVEREAPPAHMARELSATPSSAIQPPPLPPGAPNAGHSRQRQIATAANALWGVFLKGKDLPVAAEGWTQAAHKLGENIGPILDFLRGLGGST